MYILYENMFLLSANISLLTVPEKW